MSAAPHPDAKLIDLGRQFETTLVLARKHLKTSQALVGHADHLIAKAGIPVRSSDRTKWQQAKARALDRACGYRAATDAYNRQHSECIRLMKAIHRTKATTLEGFAIKIAAIVFDQSDFEVAQPVGEDVAERMLYRFARDMAKVAALVGSSEATR